MLSISTHTSGGTSRTDVLQRIKESNAFLTPKKTATALTGSKVRQQKQWPRVIESCLLALQLAVKDRLVHHL